MKKILINLSIPVLAALFIAGVILATNTFPTTLNDWSSGETIESDWADALEAKIGVDSSAVTTSLDYLLRSASSADPGHIHTIFSTLEVTTLSTADAYFMVSSADENDGDVFIVDGSWNVGIGDNDPDAILEVTSTSATAAVDYFYISSSESGDGDILRVTTTGTITFNDAYIFPTTDGTSSYQLTTDGSGNLSWAAASGSFQIPEYEILDPISGEEIKVGDFVLGTIDYTLPDGALHGLWTKFDNVKEELCPNDLEDRIEALENRIEELELSRWDKLINYFK